ncbi:HNH endonuclease [Tabrizicola soli]|uniref:HNH endonuclease n=1 Tax=Tabrizicola soli TaxID=2185115 RepID=UPI00363C35CC
MPPRQHRREKPRRWPDQGSCVAPQSIFTRSDGGGNSADNIVAACWYCNNLRHRRKRPLSPEAHRHRVQQRMAAGKWLAAQIGRGVLHT